MYLLTKIVNSVITKLICAIACISVGQHAYAVSAGSAAPLATARSNHTATQLTNGSLLIVGGETGASANTPSASVERYDPHANAWSAAAALPVARTDHTATLLDNGRVLIVGGRSVAGSETALATAVLFDPTTNTWSNAGNLTAARSQHTATRLRNGKILVVGGKNGTTVLASAELYDPATNAWTAAGNLTTARRSHTATAVSAGIGDDVIVIGGNDSGNAGLSFGVNTIERYSAGSNNWFTFSATLNDRRYAHTATALPNGDILIAGGLSAQVSGFSTIPISRNSVERFALGTLSVTPAGTLREARGRHSATVLPSGNLMLIGGVNESTSTTYRSSVETFDPVTGDATLEPAMATARADHTATLIPTGAIFVAGGRANAATVTASAALVRTAAESSVGAVSNCGQRTEAAIATLADGRVLIAGGLDSFSDALADARIYDPIANTCTTVAPMPSARHRHTLTLLPSGKVLGVGGYNSNGSHTSEVFLFDPSVGASGSWVTVPTLALARADHTATLLADGRVLIFGGSLPTVYITPTVEIFDPATNAWSSQLVPNSRGVSLATALLANGQLLLAGGTMFGSLLPSGVYDPLTGSFTDRPMATPRAGATATLLPNGKVLVVGGVNASLATLASAERFDPVTQSWTTTPPLANARYGHTATLLASGEVLVAGGNLTPTTSEIYDPVSNAWRSGPTLQAWRRMHNAISAPNGGALLIGGDDSGSVELVGPILSPVTAQTPSLSAPSAALNGATAATFSGTGFRPNLEASDGNTAQSASNAPVFELVRIDNGQRRFLPQGNNLTTPISFTNTTFTASADALAGFPHGHAILRTWVNGVPSAGRVVLVATTPFAPSLVLASLASPTSANVQFLNAPTSDGGAPITRYVFTSNPPGAGNSCNVPCSSVVVSGLTAGMSYTFQVAAQNAQGIGAASEPSNSVVVPRRNSTTTLASSLNPSAFGQAVTFTATVLAANNGPINEAVGAVRFSIGGTTISGCGAVPVALASVPVIPVTYRASCATSALNVPGGSIVAEFSGDAQTDPSNGSISQTVNKAEQVITGARFTNLQGAATVTTLVAPGSFYSAATPGASANPFVFSVAAASSGICSVSQSEAYRGNVLPTALGTCTVLIDQAGDSNYNAAPQVSVSAPVLILPTVTMTTAGTMYVGQSRRITVNVAGAAPTGTVTITADTSSAFDLSSCVAMPLTGSGNTRTASCVMRATATNSGTAFVNASYSGDANHVSNGASVGEPLVSPPPSLNIDLSPAPDTANDAATDGLMVLRYLAGFTAAAITDNAMHPSFGRSPADVLPYLESIRDALDVNGDGNLDATVDGLLIVRYMRGLRAATGLFNGLDVGNVMMTVETESYLQLLMP